MEKYQVVVVGAGHAGIEAALASCRMGKETLLLCIDVSNVGYMACNPSIGGTSKGHLVREIDALGGEMGINADKAAIQKKMLNLAKGPAVFSLRAQEDKFLYHQKMVETISNQKNLTVKYEECKGIIVKDEKIQGVETDKNKYSAMAVVIATGVYLDGEIIIGPYVKKSGPSGYKRSEGLAESLKKNGIDIRRFKTGTPARIYRDSIDFTKLEEETVEETEHFSFMTDTALEISEPCYLTYTTKETHEIIKKNIKDSPLYNGQITGIGPRYCPSIETKIMRFVDKERHQIFVEPEGLKSDEMYVQGMSTSMPPKIQEQMYHSLPGFEKCRFAKYGYAIEYVAVNPQELKRTLEHKKIANLFFAGQINGSSGYEEAAGQGIVAGINAALKIDNKPPFILNRDEAYIGVLIDDLVTKGTEEPYRMMTARAEHRLYLRQDNADKRLTQRGYEVGLVTEERYKKYLAKQEEIKSCIEELKCKLTKDEKKEIQDKYNIRLIQGTVAELAKRPELKIADVIKYLQGDQSQEAKKAAVIEIKYDGYLKKQQAAIDAQKKIENKMIPEDIDYRALKGLRVEAREKLEKINPISIGQASRISGVSPADIFILIVYLQKNRED